MSDISSIDFLQYRGPVRAFLLKLVSNPALADDLVQDTFVKAERAVPPKSNAKAWFFSIALNVLRDHFRAKARRPEAPLAEEALEHIPSEADSAELALLKAEMSDCIAQYMTQLPERQYDVLVLHDEGGLSHAEVASVLGLTEANARVILHRGRSALRDILKKNCHLSFGDDSLPCERPQQTDDAG